MNTPAHDPLAQLLAKYQSDGSLSPAASQSPSPQTKTKKRTWTGFGDKTLWDWLNLFGVFLIPLMIGVFTVETTLQQSQLSQQQYSNSQKLADDQQKEDVLVNYQKDISDLLLNYKLGSAKDGDSVSIVARAKTLTALEKLDPNRKAVLLQFLYEAKLIGSVQLIDDVLSRVKSRDPAIVDMQHADLSQVNMGDWAGLEGVDLRWANLSAAHLNDADLDHALLGGTDLSAAQLYSADLWGAGLISTDLDKANLSYVWLNNANIRAADLSGANLRGTNLTNASLNNANIGAADLSGANLSGANLKGAIVTKKQLAQARYLKGAILPDGSVYPSQSYPIPGHVEPPPPVYVDSNVSAFAD